MELFMARPHRCTTTTEALAVLKNRLQQGIPTNSGSYVKVLQTCMKQKALLATKQVHDCIIQTGMDKNPYVEGTLMNVYIKCGALVDARRVFDQLERKNVIDWNIIIAEYAKNDHAESALELFNQMRQEGVEPNGITYVSILKACASPVALKWGKQIHEFIRHACFDSDVRLGTALLKMYAKVWVHYLLEHCQPFDTILSRRIIEPHGLLSNKEMIKEAIRLAESAPNFALWPTTLSLQKRRHCRRQSPTSLCHFDHCPTSNT
ncbi:unnamed protein product [Calypogeia fissa]